MHANSSPLVHVRSPTGPWATWALESTSPATGVPRGPGAGEGVCVGECGCGEGPGNLVKTRTEALSTPSNTVCLPRPGCPGDTWVIWGVRAGVPGCALAMKTWQPSRVSSQFLRNLAGSAFTSSLSWSDSRGWQLQKQSVSSLVNTMAHQSS